MTISEIKRQYNCIEAPELAEFIGCYQSDQRAGVCALVARAERRLKRYQMGLAHLDELQAFDLSYGTLGAVIGVDEAGRGPLAGPVVAAACQITASPNLIGLDDSKKVSQSERERLYDVILASAITYGVGIVEPAEIDRINILNATKLAMTEALKTAALNYKIILTDYVTLDETAWPLKPIVKGDAKSLSIAAASIIAKVTRDRLMCDYHELYPQYGFDRHKGYGTAEHISAIKNYGASPIHRKSFIMNL